MMKVSSLKNREVWITILLLTFLPLSSLGLIHLVTLNKSNSAITSEQEMRQIYYQELIQKKDENILDREAIEFFKLNGNKSLSNNLVQINFYSVDGKALTLRETAYQLGNSIFAYILQSKLLGQPWNTETLRIPFTKDNSQWDVFSPESSKGIMNSLEAYEAFSDAAVYRLSVLISEWKY